MDASEFPDSLVFVYINHVKSLIFTFSKETLIRDSQLIPLFETVFQEMFSDKYESELLLHIKDFTFRKDSSSTLFDYFMKVFNELKAKFINSIPNEINLNGKNKQQIVSEHKRRNIKSEISESFSFNFIRKIEFSLAVGCLLNNPQKLQFGSAPKKIILIFLLSNMLF